MYDSEGPMGAIGVDEAKCSAIVPEDPGTFRKHDNWLWNLALQLLGPGRGVDH